MKQKKWMLGLFFLPALILLGHVAIKEYDKHSGNRFRFRIYGYDPRDLLSGQYLQYNIDWGMEGICQMPPMSHGQYFEISPTLCLEPRFFSPTDLHPGDHCKIFIKGECHGARFIAGVERFYVPQDQAKKLEYDLSNQEAEVVLSINGLGVAQTVDLLFNGKSWKDYIKD